MSYASGRLTQLTRETQEEIALKRTWTWKQLLIIYHFNYSKEAVIKQAAVLITIWLLAVSGCKKDDAGPTGDGDSSTTAFELIAGRSWTYSGQSYQTNGTPIPNSALQTSLTVQTTGQTIGGIAHAAVMRLAYIQGTNSASGNITVAYDQDRFMIYNGTGSNSNESPSLSGWSTLFDFKKDVTVRPVLSFDSTYQIILRSEGILRDRVRYNMTMRYIGEETVSVFNTPNISCSKYLFTFTYDAVIDTGGVSLYNGNVINTTLTIWFSPSIGFVKLRGDFAQFSRLGLQSLNDLKISHDPVARYHSSPGVSYYFIGVGGIGYESFSLNAGTGTQAGYAIFEGLSRNV